MKTYKKLFESVLDHDNLEKAIMRSSLGKRDRPDAKEIIKHKEYHIEKIQKLLRTRQLTFRKHKPCIIYDGINKKVRTIIKPDFKYEQIIHHAIVQAMHPFFMKGMYGHVCGSVPKRGAHYGKRYIEKWIRKDQRNVKYILKTDVRHFFETIDHSVLKNKLQQAIRDDDMLWLLFCVIDQTEKGLPLGYYTSQWLANWYLQELDHFIKEELKAKYYVRYMDDMVILGNNKKSLHKMFDEIESFMKTKLNIEIKGNWQVFRFDYISKKDGKRKGRPLDFLGFKFYRDKTVLRRTIMLKATRKAKAIGKKEKATIYDIQQMMSYIGWMKHTDTYYMYQQRIKPNVDMRSFRKKVGRYTKRMNKRRNQNERLDMGAGKPKGTATRG